MTHRSPVPPSPAFEDIARGAQFRDLIAIIVQAPPEAVFQALHEVALRDMKIAWALGEIRYLPSRLAGHMPPAEAAKPFASAGSGATATSRPSSAARSSSWSSACW